MARWAMATHDWVPRHAPMPHLPTSRQCFNSFVRHPVCAARRGMAGLAGSSRRAVRNGAAQGRDRGAAACPIRFTWHSPHPMGGKVATMPGRDAAPGRPVGARPQFFEHHHSPDSTRRQAGHWIEEISYGINSARNTSPNRQRKPPCQHFSYKRRLHLLERDSLRRYR